MKLTFTLLLNLFFAGSILAQTFCLRLTEVSNDGSNLIVKIEMSGNMAFDLGSSNLQWSFNTSKISTPTLESSPLGAPFYLTSVTTPNPGEASMNFDLGFAGFGSTVNTSWTELGQVNFTVLDPTDSGEMLWLYNGGTTQTVVYDDDETTQLFATDPACLEGLLSPLSVELLSFKAKKEGNEKARLSWATASEENNLGFEVQKSKDGIRWEEIDWLPGNGMSYIRREYQTMDTNPFEGANYYRLKIVEEDLSFVYSPLEVLYFERSIEVLLYPNPAKGEVFFDLQKDVSPEKIVLYNQVGKIQYETTLVEDHHLDLSHLSPGIYFVEMRFAQQIIRKRLILN